MSEPGTDEKPKLADRLKARFAELRVRFPVLDHGARAFEHYSSTQAPMLSGAVTYFGLLSFFPIIAVVFGVLGFVVKNNEDVRDAVLDAMQSVLPGIFDQIDTESIASAATTASVFGVLGLFYSGLGWLSALRTSLQQVFAVPKAKQGNMVIGKITDLVVLAMLGLTLLLSVASTSIVTALTGDILSLVGLADDSGQANNPISTILVRVLGIGIGVAASTVLFLVLFRVLGKPLLPTKALREGAVLAAVGFEVLKLLATTLIGSTLNNPVYGTFALVIALLVWISYFARLTLFGAAWAATADRAAGVVESRLAREAEATLVSLRPEVLDVPTAALPNRDRGALVAGAALGAAAVGLAVSLRKVADAADDGR